MKRHAGDLEGLQARLGIRFEHPELLLSALTHRSWLNEVEVADSSDGERLEFLGDALLDFIAGDHLFRVLPEASEGELTRLRAALVCEPALAGFARQIGLGDYLRLGKGEAASGGRKRPAILGDAFESLLGAIYLDRGFETSEQFLMRFLEPELQRVRARRRIKDAKSRFQELSQQRWQITPRYLIVETSGPDHAREFLVEVRVDDRRFGLGRGASKAQGAQQAAEAALELAERVDSPEEVDRAPDALA